MPKKGCWNEGFPACRGRNSGSSRGHQADQKSARRQGLARFGNRIEPRYSDSGQKTERGLSSVGRALPLQGRCQEFESPRLHSKKTPSRDPGGCFCMPMYPISARPGRCPTCVVPPHPFLSERHFRRTEGDEHAVRSEWGGQNRAHYGPFVPNSPESLVVITSRA